MGHFTWKFKENGVLLDKFETNSDASLFWWLCHRTKRWSSRSSFYIFAIQTIPCSSIHTSELELLVLGAKNQFMVLPTVVTNAGMKIMAPFFINHVRNCRLGCTIPCTQSILSFSLMKRHIILNKKTNKRPNANSAMNLADNTLIAVTAATSTFTPHVLPYRPPSNLLKSTTTH